MCYLGIKNDETFPYLRIIPRPLVLVFHEEANGRTESDAVLDTGLELDEILFVALFISV